MRLIARRVAALSRDAASGVLQPGQELRVGRTPPSQLVLPGDRQLGAVQFTLCWDGERASLKHVAARPDTYVNGEVVRGEVELQHGDWIRAGRSDLLVYLEDCTPPPLRPPDGNERADRAELAERTLGELRAQGTPLFAVVDAARDARIMVLLRQSVDTSHSLYEGVQGHVLEEVAPHLVQLRADSRLLERLVTEGWGRRWGVFLTSEAKFWDVRRHLRRFLTVASDHEPGRKYFRFYDPQVMRPFLPSCTLRQRCTFFGAYRERACDGDRYEPDDASWRQREGQDDLIRALWLEDEDLRLVRRTVDEPGALADDLPTLEGSARA